MPIHSPSRSFAACLLAGLPAVSMAIDDGSEAAFFEPLPVVLTASRLPQPQQDTPGAVSVIDESLIEATGYRDIGRLLRLVPGMQIGQERGNTQWITYHGLGMDYPNQMQVLIDGRSVYSPLVLGGADWGKLPLAISDIERIEVVRGSNSAAYGSNAFLGVVNILTRHSSGEAGPSVHFNLGDHGIADFVGRGTLQHGALGLRLTAQHQEDSGFDDMRDGRRIDSFNLRGDLRLGPADELNVYAGMSQGTRGFGFVGTPFNGSGERDARHDDGFVHLRWRHAPSADEEFSLAWYRTREDLEDRWALNDEGLSDGVPGGPVQQVPIDNDRSSVRDNIELQHHLAFDESLRLLWGTEWRRDHLDAPSLFAGKGERRQDELRLFGNLEWRAAPAWLWNLGLMAEHFGGGSTELAPRVFLNWQADRAQTLRLGYSRAYRQPTLFEQHGNVRILDPDSDDLLYRQFVANPDIRPQRIDSVELGYLAQFGPGNGVFDLRLFHERVSQLIRRVEADVDALTPIEDLVPPSTWDNYPHAVRLKGLEYQLRVQPWRDGELILNHSLIRTAAPDRAVERLVAPYTLGLTWLQRYGPWQSSLSVMRLGRIDAGTGYVRDYSYTVPAHTTLDASIARRFTLGGCEAELRLSGINLLGSHQELSHRPLQRVRGSEAANEVGRQIHASFGMRF